MTSRPATITQERATYHAVVFDLFGTLIDAPTVRDRNACAVAIARDAGTDTATAESVLASSWAIRHDGRLPTLAELAGWLACQCADPPAVGKRLAATLLAIARRRLVCDGSVIDMLHRLRARGIRVGVLSDASADVATAWAGIPLSRAVDVAIFSCRVGAVKPAPKLYRTVIEALRVDPTSVLYCGDGGGAELAGAQMAGFDAVKVRRRGSRSALAYGERDWRGDELLRVELIDEHVVAGPIRATR